MIELHFSIIVPVYNRPDEMREFLESLANQTDKNFEVMVMEGDSTIPCKDVCKDFSSKLNIRYIHEPNSGRSRRRNLGVEMASGNYCLLFDSDCIIPPNYISNVRELLSKNYVDCYGGPDNADESFSDTQKAINYSMTSIMTTGGIRGGMKNSDKFLPRSFNMGFSKAVYEKVGGYREMIGEDIDLSMKIKEAGFKTALFKEAYVYHKRKIDFKKFYKQVYTFGKARILLSKLHKNALKLVFLLPVCFVLGNILLVLLSIIFQNALFLLPIAIYILAIFIESFIKNKSIKIAFLSIATSYIQLFGYGFGFLDELMTCRASKAAQEEAYQ